MKVIASLLYIVLNYVIHFEKDIIRACSKLYVQTLSQDFGIGACLYL